MSQRDIIVTPQERIQTWGGDVLHAMKKGDVGYADFGEAYFSWVGCGAIKGWKRHSQMTMNIVVPVGQVKFVFHTEGSKEFRVEEVGIDNYAHLTVPPGIWFAFQGISGERSLVLNISSIPHDPNEVERITLSEIKYDWS